MDTDSVPVATDSTRHEWKAEEKAESEVAAPSLGPSENVQEAPQTGAVSLPNDTQSTSKQSPHTLPATTDLNRNRVGGKDDPDESEASQTESTVVVTLCSDEGADVTTAVEYVVVAPCEPMEKEKQEDHQVNEDGSSCQSGEDAWDDAWIIEDTLGKHSPVPRPEDNSVKNQLNIDEDQHKMNEDQLKMDEELARQLQAEEEVDREAVRRLQEEEDARLAAQLWQQVNTGMGGDEDIIGFPVPGNDSVVSVADDDEDVSEVIDPDEQIRRDEEMARQLEKQLEQRGYHDHESDSDNDVQLVQEFEDSQLARELSHQEASSFSTVTSQGKHMTALERLKVQVELNRREKEKQKANFKEKCSNQVAHGRQQIQQLQNTPERQAALQQAQSGLNQWLKYKAPWEKGHRKRNLMPRQTLDGPIPCPVINCGSRFATPYMLTAHMETFCHSPCDPSVTLQPRGNDVVEKFACVACGKCFLSRAAHDHHVNTTMKSRNTARLTHHWKLPGIPVFCYACPACGLCFSSTEECLAHVMEKRHQNYQSIEPIPLTRNIYEQLTTKCGRVNFTVKCNECRARFTRHSQIQRHYVTIGCNGSPVAYADKHIITVLKEMAPISYCTDCTTPLTSLQAASAHTGPTHTLLKLKDNMPLLFLTLGWQAEAPCINVQKTTWPWRRLSEPTKVSLKVTASRLNATASSSVSTATSSAAASSSQSTPTRAPPDSRLVRFPFPQDKSRYLILDKSRVPNLLPGIPAATFAQLPFNQTVRFPLPRPPASVHPQLLDIDAPGVNPAATSQLAQDGSKGTKRCRSESEGDMPAVLPPASQMFPRMVNKKKQKKKKGKVKHAPQHQQTSFASPQNKASPSPAAKRARHSNPTCATLKQTDVAGTSTFVTTGGAGFSGSGNSVPDPPEDVCHVIFVDLDNWGAFFSKLPQPLTDKTFVYGFKGGTTIWSPPHHNNRAYQTIMSKKCFYLHPQCSKRKDAADFAICVHAGRLDERIPKHIPFTVLSGDGGFHELANQLQRSNRRTHIVSPHHQDADIVLATLNSIGET